MHPHYTATATAIGGRQGRIRSSDGVLDQPLAHPKELGGPGGAGATNPEQLFAAGYAACFENALLRVARERKTPIRESSVTAHVTPSDGRRTATSGSRSSSRSRSRAATGRRSRNWRGPRTRRSAPIRMPRAATSTCASRRCEPELAFVIPGPSGARSLTRRAAPKATKPMNASGLR